MIIEGVKYNKQSDTFDFIWKEDAPDDLINLKLQKYNRVLSKKDGNKVYYAYKLNKDAGSETKILKQSIKYVDDKVSESDVNLMINKAVASFNAIDDLSSYDLVVTPKSTSKVLDLMRNAIGAKAGPNTMVSSDLFVKNTIDNIKFDEEKLSKVPEKERNQIVKILNTVFSKEDYKLRSVSPRFRKFILNFVKFNTEVNKRVMNRIVNGKILVVDDILTEGTTVKNIVQLLNSAGASEVVSFVLLTDR
jgi:phosphoribosylpyrophosphate synthetase